MLGLPSLQHQLRFVHALPASDRGSARRHLRPRFAALRAPRRWAAGLLATGPGGSRTIRIRGAAPAHRSCRTSVPGTGHALGQAGRL